MIRLGIRLATAGGRGAIVGLVLSAVAVGLGTAVLLFALSFEPAVTDRTDRAAWRSPTMAVDKPGMNTGLLFAAMDDRYADRGLFEAWVAPLDATAPIPPGITRIPVKGEAFVSPALARLMAVTPADQLGDRIGRIAGTVGDDALRSPDELVAIIGSDVATLERAGSGAVTSFPERGRLPGLPPVAMLLVALSVAGALAPVAVFVASATRLSAARREQRLSALRLVGATPLQTAHLAAVEALVATALGATLGVGFFLLLRPLVALIPLDDATWFAGSITPPIAQAALLLLMVPVVGVVAALLSLRRIAVSPLGVQRRATPRMPGARRLLPLGLSIIALLGMLVVYRQTGGADEIGVFVIAGAFAGVIVGIAVAGPWLTAMVGRALGRLPAGGATLLAARRLTDDPRGSFGSIAGVVMAIFVATTFLTFASTARLHAGGSADLQVRPGTVVAQLPSGDAASGIALAARLRTLTGIGPVVSVRGVAIGSGDSVLGSAWVVPCRDLLAVLEPRDAACGSGLVHRTGGLDLPAGTYTIRSEAVTTDGGEPAALTLTLRAKDLDSLAPAGVERMLAFPDLVIEPAALPKTAPPLATTRLYVATDGSLAAAERARTAILAASPAFVRRSDESTSSMPIYDEIGRVVILGLVGTMVLAGCSLAVAVTTAVADRRRQFVFLRSAGMSATSLRSLVVLQTGAPLVAVAALSAALGVLVTQAIFAMADIRAVLGPDLGTLGILVASIGIAMLVVVLTLPSLDRMTRPETLRVE